MVIVDGWVTFEPAALEAFRAAAGKMIAASRAEAGCLGYAYAADFLDPGCVRITEHWVDEAALTAHFAEPHMAEFQAALAQAKRIDGDVRIYSGDEIRRLI